MSTVLIRPNATVQAGTGTTIIGGAPNVHTALSDNTSATSIRNSINAYGGNTAPPAGLAVVSFPDVTGLIPAGRTILSVALWMSGPKGTAVNSSGVVSLRYSDQVEAARLTFTTAATAVIESRTTTLATAVRYDGATSKGNWTYALVDGLTAVIGSVMDGGKGAGYTNEVYLVVTYTDEPPVPTSVTPANGATVTTFDPVLGATLVAPASGQKIKAEWQFATNTGFTANVKTITESDADLRLSGPTTESPTTLDLTSNTWYMRARAKDQYGLYGQYSSTNTLTVNHPSSSVGQTPTGGKTIAYGATVALKWTFSDPAIGDTQTAYEVEVENNESGATIIDTGKVTSGGSATTYNAAIPAGNKDQSLRWRVKTWDSQDDTAGFSNWQNFRVSDAPVVNVTAPAEGSTVSTGAPTVTWTVSNGTQTSWTVTFRRQDTDALVHSASGTGATLTYTPSTNVLQNTVAYKATVAIVDTDGLGGTDSNNFTASYVAPDPVQFTSDATDFEEKGYILLDWSQMQEDEFFVSWQIYRRTYGSENWTQIATYDYDHRNTRTFKDWLVPAGDTVEYAITQTGVRSGVLLESPQLPNPPLLAYSTHYWIINLANEDESMKLDHVTGDTFTDNYEEEELLILGRGRKMNTGTRYGYNGSLVAELRDNLNGTARQKRMQLQILKDAKTAYYLRNPFGDVILIHIGNLQFSRISGVGVSEFVDVTIPYMEVF